MAFDPNIMPIRASAFGGLFDCSLRFEMEQLRGLRMPNSPRALIGTGTHAATAAFDQAKLDGQPMRIDDAAGIAVDAIAERIASEGVAWQAGEPDRREVERVALRLSTTYCAEISPRYEFAAVELTTQPLDVDCGGGLVVRLTGTLDRCRIRKNGSGRGISDVKTGRAAVSDGVARVAKHRAQLGTYELLYEHTTGVECDEPAEIIGLNSGGTFATGNGFTNRPRDLLLGVGDRPGLIELGAAMFRSGMFPPNPQSFLCSAKYCAFHAQCPYAER